MAEVTKTGHNETESHSILLPTLFETVAFIFAGVLYVALAKLSHLLQSGDIKPATQVAKASFLEKALEVSNSDLVSRIVPSLAWFALGGLLYLLVWTLIVFVVDSYNNVVVSSSFSHPTSFHQSAYWFAIGGRFLTRIAAGLVLAFTLISIIKLVPLWYDRSVVLGVSGSLKTDIASGFTVILTIFALLYVVTVSLRFLFLKRRLLG